MAYFGNNAANAWATVDMTSTASFADSYNMASVTDHATGDNELYFDTDFANTNYCAVVHSENWEGSNGDSGCAASSYKGSHRTAGSMRFANYRLRFDTGNLPQMKDSGHVGWAFFGDQ